MAAGPIDDLPAANRPVANQGIMGHRQGPPLPGVQA